MIAIFMFAITSVGNAAVIPYLPPLQNFGGTSVDLATFFPTTSDYTLEVQATAGTQISVADGVYTYTPEATGVVRFSQKRGKVYVYEGSVYKTTLTPNPVSATFTDIYSNVNDAAAQTGIYDAANLIVNPGFETTTGPNLNNEADKRYAAANWTPMGNFTSFTSGGVRINVDNTSYITGREGVATLMWRNDAASANNINTYVYQSLGSKLLPNTAYKIKFHVLTHNQSKSCNWRVGVGSTSGGYEYSLNVFNTVNTNFTSKTYEYTFVTPSTIATETFFTIGNAGDATTSNWTIIHLDRITLVKGLTPTGVTGVTAATFIEGAAYAPENISVNFEAGDYYDMTSYIANSGFEDIQADKQENVPGWTKTGTANSEYCTRNDAGPASFKTGNVYFQYWSSTRPDFSISQLVTGLPNGKYRLTAAAGGDAGTTGTYVYAGDNQTHVTSTGDHSVDAIVVNGTLTIGFKSVSRTVSWAFADNFRLYYLGVVLDPVLSVSATSFFFDTNNLEKTFTVSGANLTANVALTAPAGITLDKTSLTPAEVAAGATVTATYDNATAILNQKITIISGTVSQEINVIGSADATCFIPMGSPNLIPNPYLNSLVPFAGWGHKSIVYGAEAYCGAAAVKFNATTNTYPNGAALDVKDIAWEANSTYRVRAMVKSVDGTFAFFAKGANPDVTISIAQSNDEWVLIDQTFTTGAAPTTNFFSFNNVDGGSTGKVAFIDNWELFKVGTTTSVSSLRSASKLNAFIQNGRVVANFEANVDGKAELAIYNVQGVELAKVNANVAKGQNEYTFNTELPSGVYVIRMSENNITTTVKVVK